MNQLAIKNCHQCKEQNKAFEIAKILQWRGKDNYLSSLAYDKSMNQILINKDTLMRAIQMANPGQSFRDIKLITHEEYKKIRDKTSDFTSDDEKVWKENMTQ